MAANFILRGGDAAVGAVSEARGSDPGLILKQLLSIGERTTTLALKASMSALVIDFNDFLKTAPVEECSSDSGPTPITKANIVSPKSAPSAPESKSTGK